MARRGSTRKLQSMADILPQVLKKQKIPFHFEDQTLRRIWDQAVGPQIAAQTAPRYVKKAGLYITVATSVWMHQLQFMKEEIIFKFNERSGQDPINSLHFSLGELPVRPSGNKRKTSAAPVSGPLKPRDQRVIRESLSVIQDAELKTILERVMAKEIGRRRLLEKKRGR